MNQQEKKELIRNYLKQNPTATYNQIRKDTKLKLERIYGKNCVKNAYLDAKIPFSKPLLKRTKTEMRKQTIKYIQNNPKTANTVTILKNINVNIPRTFGTIREAYKLAKVEYFPQYKIHGSALYKIRRRAVEFETNILTYLEKFGKVKKKIRLSNRKEVDGLLIYKNQKFVIEIKNYIKKNITLSEIKQLIGYMKYMNCRKGLIIHSYPKNKKSKRIKIKDLEITLIYHNQLNNFQEIIN
jgi:hypothetical protein